MNVLKKYTWLVGTLMRAGDKGLTLEQIGDRWNATEELHEEGAFARRSFHRQMAVSIVTALPTMAVGSTSASG